jgi:hypothetical protein
MVKAMLRRRMWWVHDPSRESGCQLLCGVLKDWRLERIRLRLQVDVEGSVGLDLKRLVVEVEVEHG